jgi:membrane-associated phospholipid phosphatase
LFATHRTLTQRSVGHGFRQPFARPLLSCNLLDVASTTRTAKLTGQLLNPFAIFTVLFFWVAAAENGFLEALLYTAVELLAAVVVIAFLLARRRVRKISGFWLARRQERLVPAIVLIAVGVSLFLLLWALRAGPELLAVTSSVFVAAMAVALLTLLWKASAHATVAGHAAVSALILLGWWGIVFALLLPAVLWARVAEGAHTAGQVLAGAAIGGAVAAVFLLL